MELTDRLSRGVKALFGADLLDKLSQAALIVVLTRYLFSTEQYGELNFVLSVVGVVTIFATLGVPKSAARYVTEFAETDPAHVPHVLRLSFAYISILVVTIAAGMIVFGGQIASILGVPSVTPYLVVGAGLVAVKALTKYCSALFQGFNRVAWTAMISAVVGIGRLILVILFVLLGFGIAGALAGYLAASLLAAVLGAVVLYRRFYDSNTAAASPPADLGRRILEYSVPLTATRGANVLDKKVDTILVGVLLNMTAVGYYTIAKQVSDFVTMPAATFGFTVSPAIGQEYSGDRLDRATALYERSLQYVLLLYIPGVTGLILVADPMVRYIFGSGYLPAVPVVQVFALFILVNAINKVTSDGLDYLGRARSRAIIKSAMAVANFVLNLALIPLLGVVGAAVATVLTYTVYTLSNVYFIHQELGFDLWAVLRSLATICLVTVGMGTSVWIVIPYVSGLPSLFGVVIAGLVVWASLSMIGGLLDLREVFQFIR